MSSSSVSNRKVSEPVSGEQSVREKGSENEGSHSEKVRLWLQYAGIVLVATAYIAGLIGWTYVSLSVEDDAAAVPLYRDLRAANAEASSPVRGVRLGMIAVEDGR